MLQVGRIISLRCVNMGSSMPGEVGASHHYCWVPVLHYKHQWALKANWGMAATHPALLRRKCLSENPTNPEPARYATPATQVNNAPPATVLLCGLVSRFCFATFLQGKTVLLPSQTLVALILGEVRVLQGFHARRACCNSKHRQPLRRVGPWPH